MLRPAVATKNCAKAGGTSGLDIGGRGLSMENRGRPARHGRAARCPDEGRPSTRCENGVIAASAPASDRHCCKAEISAGFDQNLTQNVVFSPYIDGAPQTL